MDKGVDDWEILEWMNAKYIVNWKSEWFLRYEWELRRGGRNEK